MIIVAIENFIKKQPNSSSILNICSREVKIVLPLIDDEFHTKTLYTSLGHKNGKSRNLLKVILTQEKYKFTSILGGFHFIF